MANCPNLSFCIYFYIYGVKASINSVTEVNVEYSCTDKFSQAFYWEAVMHLTRPTCGNRLYIKIYKRFYRIT